MRKANLIILLYILVFSSSCIYSSKYEADNQKARFYFGKSKSMVKNEMKDAIMVHSGELTSRPRYDSTFKWEYLPRKSQNLDYEIEDLYDKVILVIRTKNGKVTKVIKSHKYESLEIMKSSFKSKIAGLVEEYWVTECVYGPFNDLKTFKTTYQNISDWETLSKCNFASWDIDISDKERYQLQVSFEIDYEEEKYEDMITVYEEIKGQK